VSDVREPAVAGQFYPADPETLRDQIVACFEHEVGPGAAPGVQRGPRTLAGLVSPHAGYPYSGPVAAHGFAALAEDGPPGVVVALGPNHTGVGAGVAVSPAERWRTPLGDVPVDADLAACLTDAVEDARLDARAHAGEHSLEVQLPFLQYLFGNDVPIVPVCLRDQSKETALAISDALGDLVGNGDREALLLASTDLTHYAPQDRAEAADSDALDRIAAFDIEGLYELVRRENHTMCGYGPVAAVLSGARRAGATSVERLAYATSGDTGGSADRVVGYCSVGVRRQT
jgi:hypothetical protein